MWQNSEIYSQWYVSILVFAYLNINSIRTKFELLKDQNNGNMDILMISETKIDNNFPHSQFFIEGFSISYSLERDSNGAGILLYCIMING